MGRSRPIGFAKVGGSSSEFYAAPGQTIQAAPPKHVRAGRKWEADITLDGLPAAGDVILLDYMVLRAGDLGVADINAILDKPARQLSCVPGKFKVPIRLATKPSVTSETLVIVLAFDNASLPFDTVKSQILPIETKVAKFAKGVFAVVP